MIGLTASSHLLPATQALEAVVRLQQAQFGIVGTSTLGMVSSALQNALCHMPGSPGIYKPDVPKVLVSAPDAVDWDNEPIPVSVEAVRCKALLLEVIRRAAHDWVLYRQHTRLPLKEIAQAAHVWLFEEGPGYPGWDQRENCAWHMTAFVNICEELDIDPDVVRQRVLRMRVSEIVRSGRPIERRYRVDRDDASTTQHPVHVDVDIGTLDDDPSASVYENYYRVGTAMYGDTTANSL